MTSPESKMPLLGALTDTGRFGAIGAAAMQDQLLRYAADLRTVLNQRDRLEVQQRDIVQVYAAMIGNQAAMHELIGSSPVPYLMTNSAGMIEVANDAAAQLLPGTTLRGVLLESLLAPQSAPVLNSIKSQLNAGADFQGDAGTRLLCRAAGSTVQHFQVLATPFPVRVEGQLQCIHWRLEIAPDEQAGDAASQSDVDSGGPYDALTRLPGVALLQDRVQQLIVNSRHRNETFNVLLVHIDAYPQLLAEQGAEQTNLALCEVASRLLGCVAEIDSVCRFVEDQFVILAPETGSGDSRMVALAGRIIEAMASPVAVSGNRQVLGVSLGGARFPEHGERWNQLAAHARAAARSACAQGGGRLVTDVEAPVPESPGKPSPH